MRLTLLGTGSPVPSLRRASTSFLVETGGDTILLDHGAGSFGRLIETGHTPGAVSHLLLSHLHFDHCADFVRLFFHRWDMAGPDLPPLKVFGPAGTAHFVDRLFGQDGAFKADLTARTQHPISQRIYESRGGVGPRPWPTAEVTEFGPDGTVSGDGWTARFAEVPHHQPYLDCFGMRLEADGGVLCYSSDISRPTEAALPLQELGEGADLLIHYLNAFDLTRPERRPGEMPDTKQHIMGALAERLGIGTLVTYHHGPAMDRPGVRERLIADIGEVYSGRIVWGEDRSIFDIPG
jgi:ribonuclease Z